MFGPQSRECRLVSIRCTWGCPNKDRHEVGAIARPASSCTPEVISAALIIVEAQTQPMHMVEYILDTE